MKVGFIGLGKMGQGMARNLLKSGVKLVVFDTNQEAVKAFVEAGAERASSVAEMARMVGVVFTSLPGPIQVEEVALGSHGLLENMSTGLVMFDLSTSSLALAKRISAAFKEKGGAMLDAPISGGPAGAASGDLAFWVGGDKEVFETHIHLFNAMGNGVRHVGPNGAGVITKLAHNGMGYMMMLTMAEMFTMAVKGGMDPLELWEALRLGLVGKQSPLFMLTSQFLPGKYETPAMALKLGHKDMALCAAVGKDLGVPMRLANMTLEEMTEAISRGFGEQDSRAFLKLQLERAGVEIGVDPDRLQAAITVARS